VDAVTTEPRALVEAVALPSRAANLAGQLEESALRRRAAGRQPEQDRLADHLVAVAPHLSRDTKVVPGTARGTGDGNQSPIGRSHVRQERAPVECVEPGATPPPPSERKSDTEHRQPPLRRRGDSRECDNDGAEDDRHRAVTQDVGGREPQAQAGGK
jgi:hypothetical protein